MMNRDERKLLAEETVKISKEGQYKVNNKYVFFNTPKNFQYFDKFAPVHNEIMNCEFGTGAKITVTNESTIAAIHRFGNNNLGVLNFASAKNPGGGFLGGSMAQEECLAYCSDLYIKQWPAGKDYYEKHRENPNPFYSHTMFIDDVTFFRDADFDLIEDFTTCKVLTSAAVNMGVAIKQGKSQKEAKAIMKQRMKNILAVFAYCRCKNLILGAFGCGVFGNSAEDVAQMWKELLFDEGYSLLFDNVCFAVLDSKNTNNYAAFKKTFKR